MKVDVKDWTNKKAGDIELKDDIYKLPLRTDILNRVVEWQRAKKQAGTHKTKTVGEIRGTTKKPFRQKGTGNARQGSLRSAQMRGGQTTFGPQVRSHAYSLPKKLRKLALKTALSSKLASKNLHVVKDAALKAAKTKDVVKGLKALELSSVLVIDGAEVNDNFRKALANVKYVDLLPGQGANVYDILRHEDVILTEAGVKYLEERLA